MASETQRLSLVRREAQNGASRTYARRAPPFRAFRNYLGPTAEIGAGLLSRGHRAGLTANGCSKRMAGSAVIIVSQTSHPLP